MSTEKPTGHYKRTRSYDVEFARPVAVRSFCGVAWVVFESVIGDRANVETATWSDVWEDATEAEWDAAVRRASKAKAKRDKHEAWLTDAERFGVKVTAGEADVVIVRVTKTTIVGIDGGKWLRGGGRPTPRSYFGRRITPADLAKIEAAVDGRERVDIVAERKAKGLAS